MLALLFQVQAQYNRDDYEKADSVVNHMAKLIYGQVKNVYALGNNGFCYKTKTRSGIRYYLVDTKKNSKKLAFNHEKLAAQLSEKTKKNISVDKMVLSGEEFSAEADTFKFKTRGYHWLYLTGKSRLIQLEKIKPAAKRKHWAASRNELGKAPVLSPSKEWEAYIQEYNLYVESKKTGEKHQLSYDGSPGEFYSSYIKWSPDSKYIAVHKFKPSEKRFMKFVQSSPDDQIQPKLIEIEYLKPGDAMPIKQPRLFSIEGKKQIPVDCNAYLNQYYLTDPVWRKDSRAFTIEFNQRGHQQYSVLEIEATGGKVTILAEEKYETFFNYSGKKFRKDINDGEEMIWMSERDGWNHLYLYNDKGEVINQVTKGEWVVRKVTHVDTEKRKIIFSASGMNEGEDPYHLHYYSIGFDGKGLTKLTSENANHQVTFSKDYRFFIDYYSRVDMPGKTVLCDAISGNVLTELERTDISDLKETNWQQPEVFSAKGRDGETDIWGVIYRPSNFDPNKKYPVIEYIYAGPHSSFVPKSFIGVHRRYAGLAELGFICVQIDGMGTSNRSKTFHDVCWKNLKDAGFPDRIEWMKAAAAKYNYMDIERVGIFGGSAGGQSSTGAVLFHPEFYDVAVSSCGCHDNRMDKIWWNEQWMGYPIGPHYAECSNVENAYRLQGHLMLILGEVDDNVDPASTIQVADALINADKEFELVVLPGVNHTLGGDYGERKRRDFFIKHLIGEQTPAWNN